MKRRWHHPEEPKTGKRYWGSVAQFEDTPEFREWQEREFPAAAEAMRDAEDAGDSRRNFMKLMGAATSLAGFGLASCRRPEKHILPYSKHVEWVVPGVPTMYASARPTANGAVPVVVTTHEGRPTHLQGNSLHPASNGAADSLTISSVLDLYDPDRLQKPLHEGASVSQEELGEFLAGLHEELKASKGKGVALLLDGVYSPTRDRLLVELKKSYGGLELYRNESVSTSERDEAVEAAFGEGTGLLNDFAGADRVLALDSDFLGLEQQDTASTAAFMARRTPSAADDVKGMNRLYVVENRYTVTGGAADHRLNIAAGMTLRFAAQLGRAVASETGDAALKGMAVAALGDVDGAEKWVNEAAKDLVGSKGKALVVAGARQPAAVHALVLAINSALGAFGKTAKLVKKPVAVAAGTLADLSKAIDGGKVKTLITAGSNDPAYDAPADANPFADSSKIETTVALASRLNATAMASDWVIPSAHFLEAWGDALASDGSYSIVQPTILPLFGGISEIQLLLSLLGHVADPEAGDDAEDLGLVEVKKTFAGIATGDEAVQWNLTLRDGFLADSAFASKGGKPKAAGLKAVMADAVGLDAPNSDSFELVFPADSKVFDGRGTNNGWQQEAPDPVTKITWDNAALMSPKTYRELGLDKKVKVSGVETRYPVVRLTKDGRSLDVVAIEAPGHAHYSISLSLGYGQEFGGRVGEGTGFNANALRTTSESYIASGVKLELTEERYVVATTAEEGSMKGRAIAREVSADEFKSDPESSKYHGMDSHIPENLSLYKGQTGIKEGTAPEEGYAEKLGMRETENGFDYAREHQWGMTIDLSSCLGCTSCLIACQSENNIPIVGKSQVLSNREMHWIRMDRYFASTDKAGQSTPLEELENPEMITQPVACVQCESAPCETVCPVNATVHTEDGLNAMAYNRCIGTRYCANNCPYKARRFNFFDYNKRNVLIENNLAMGPLGKRADRGVATLQKNPNVTVRMRGIMEKCTYCVQRLEGAKIKQKQKAKGSPNVQVPTDSVRTACQDACPTNAITFGNLADPKSAVVATKASPRNYDLLSYIGTLPRTSYLARVKNPNMNMPGAEKVGGMTTDFH